MNDVIELEPIEGVATKEQLEKMWDGVEAEYKELHLILANLKEFINVLCFNPDINDSVFQKIYKDDLKSTEAAAQKIGYLESKIIGSIGTIDKIALELATQIDKGKKNDTETSNPDS